MKILTDLHIHTNTPEAYSTFNEHITFAAKKKMELLAITNHSPICFNLPENHFTNMVVFPREIDGITIIRGIEADIINQQGDLDITERIKPIIEFIIASCHSSFQPTDEKMFKTTYENVIQNPIVDVLGHLCRTQNFSNLDYIIPLAKENNKIIEVNVTSFSGRINKQWTQNCKLLINKCLEYRTKICVNSDAHICYSVGDFAIIEEYLESINFPEELIMNLNRKSVLSYMKSKNT